MSRRSEEQGVSMNRLVSARRERDCCYSVPAIIA